MLLQGTESAPPQKQAAEQRPGNSSMSHPVSTRQRSMRRSSAASSGGILPQAPPLLEQSVEMQPRLSPGYHNPRGNFASQSHGGNDHPRQHRNSLRSRNGGIHPRGDGFHHQNFGGRHDQERGNQEWTSNRSFGNSRDQQQRAIPGPIRPPPPPPIPYAPFLPSPIWPYSPIGFPGKLSRLIYTNCCPCHLWFWYLCTLSRGSISTLLCSGATSGFARCSISIVTPAILCSNCRSCLAHEDIISDRVLFQVAPICILSLVRW